MFGEKLRNRHLRELFSLDMQQLRAPFSRMTARSSEQSIDRRHALRRQRIAQAMRLADAARARYGRPHLREREHLSALSSSSPSSSLSSPLTTPCADWPQSLRLRASNKAQISDDCEASTLLGGSANTVNILTSKRLQIKEKIIVLVYANGPQHKQQKNSFIIKLNSKNCD